MEIVNHTVHFLETSGNSYQTGVQQAQKLIELFDQNYFTQVSETTPKNSTLLQAIGIRPLSELTPAELLHNAKLAEKLIKTSDPELLDEIEGFAHTLKVPVDKVLAYTTNYSPGGCSTFFANGMLCRNYDDAVDGVDNLFLLTKTPGNNRHFGSSTETIGRYDGMNDQGLAVALTFGAGFASTQPGIGAVLYLRFALDKASSVKEALDIFQKTPYVSPNNVVMIDKKGDKALIEVSKGQSAITRGDDILFCANSYQNTEIAKLQAIQNITTGYREDLMSEIAPRLVTSEEMMRLLTTDFPTGLFEPHFSDGLGTLWSLVMDPKKLKIMLAIGQQDVDLKQTVIDLSTKKPTLPGSMNVQLRNIALDEQSSRLDKLLAAKQKRFN